MGKKIILLSDGTGNSAAKVWRTNVWRVFESLDLRTSDQIGFYDDGVGTSSFKPLAILGGVFGLGLRRNVLNLYMSLSRNYKSCEDYHREGIESDDDEIFAFGFSRGAFTIRVLIGLILSQGLVEFDNEPDLNRRAKVAYEAYRREKFKATVWKRLVHRAFAAMGWSSDKPCKPAARPVRKIRFLGLWDTVAAYGLPIDEMTRGWSEYFWPLEFSDRTLDITRVDRACHALSLDDERTTFHPLLWDESDLAPVAPGADGIRRTKDEKLSQVWFAGVHSNVGGGYPDDSLAHVSLNWILAEAEACGLRFKREPDSDPDAIKQALAAQDKDGRLYDSRGGMGSYYRYGPRKIDELCSAKFAAASGDMVEIPRPKIHESVFNRTLLHAHFYAPIVLPKTYEIVTYDGCILPHDQSAYETPARARLRDRFQERVWNLVWKRRAIYFLTVFTSIYFITYPFYHRVSQAAEYQTSLRVVSGVIRLAEQWLPSAAGPWINGYAGAPHWFLVIVTILVVLLVAGTRFKGLIADRMNAIWRISMRGGSLRSAKADRDNLAILRRNLRARRKLLMAAWGLLSAGAFAVSILSLFRAKPDFKALRSFWQNNNWITEYGEMPVSGILAIFFLVLALPEGWIFSLRRHRYYRSTLYALKFRVAPALSALLFLYLAVAFGNHLLFTMEDAAGLVCEKTPAGKLQTLRYCSAPTVAMCDDKGVANCPNFRVKPVCRDGLKSSHPTCSSKPDKGYVARCGDAPAICDKPCTDDVLSVPDDNKKKPAKQFSARNICFATGIALEKFGTYRISIIPDNEEKWHVFDGTIETVAGGSYVNDPSLTASQKVKMLLLWPLKRTFLRPWSTVVVRIGTNGNDESFMDADESDIAFSERKNAQLQTKFKPRRDGELFVYVNDVGIAGGATAKRMVNFINGKLKNAGFKTALPQLDWSDRFYRHNQGTAKIKIERLLN